ncbi:MAG TPA: pyruvate carboxylase [Limnochordia bacterium]|nr:pyruvate carboxylase [Limnochordia bacterium]
MARTRTLHRIMAANRGEIAIRIFRACTELGIETVAIYSQQDSLSLHRYKADEAYLVGAGKGPIEAYRDIDGIIELALRHEVDAIHPGYGFLSEDPRFAAACEQAGIVFIGPKSEHLHMFGDKVEARRIAVQAGLPVVPATAKPVESVTDALLFAKQAGYPLIVKAVAGGGGRGMRVVRDRSELEEALDRARSEAGRSFGESAVYLEKYVEHPKHIEVQVLADQNGHTVHLFERDCSVQRRHQKVVEIAPALTLTEAQRDEICAAAVKLLQSVGYVNAATVEFLVDKDGGFYFLEVNPRVQVEHTITELITGIDIVQSQIRIAEGRDLSDPEIGIPDQAAVARRGHAIQCRITTEDPANNFLPDHGRILAYRSAAGFGVRLDSGNGYAGAIIEPFYDSMLVKLCTWAVTFEQAAAKMHRALREFRIRGVKTNIPFLENVIQNPKFRSGQADTTFVDTTPELLTFRPRRDRGTRILRYIGHATVNQSKAAKQLDRDALKAPPVPEGAARRPYPDGTKQILDREGPEGLVRWIKAQKRLLVTDTTFRDAHQSLLATRVRTYDLLAIAEPTAKLAGDLFSLEMWGGATFDVALRFNKEDPWVRLERLRERIPNLCFQMLLRGANAVGYANYPDNVVRAFVRQAAATGIDVFRIFDSLNWVEGMRVAIDAGLESGKLVEAAICYTGDITDPRRDKYNLGYYVAMAKALEHSGAHVLGIKDMSGLLKPYAAEKLIKALREEVGLPIHLHTHDTSGNGVAAMLKASEAGVDIVDAALSSMSGATSQPSLNAIVAALAGTERDTGLNLASLQELCDYWEPVRAYYAPFEAGPRTGTTEVYLQEMPGGQYTNLRVQAEAVGLGDRWREVKDAYVVANRLMGDIVKVTPSSKAVGDLALFMVQNDLTEQNILTKGKNLSYPDSVITFFKGMMGQPTGGFPVEMQKLVLKEQEPITCRPGELLEPVDLSAEQQRLTKQFGRPFTERDAISSILYPSVFAEFVEHQKLYSDTSVIDTPTFIFGLRPGDETRVEIEQGKTLIIKLTAIGELLDDGTRIVHFELNGQPREVRVRDENVEAQLGGRPKADPKNPHHVAATMPGTVLRVNVNPGDVIAKGQTLVVTEAMKMETALQSPERGRVAHVHVLDGDRVEPGDLLIVLEEVNETDISVERA